MQPRQPTDIDCIDTAIKYLVHEYDADTVFTLTKLMKLLYLADRRYSADHELTLTGVQWSKYTYGPYSETIAERVRELHSDHILIQEHRTDSGVQYHHRPVYTERKSEPVAEVKDILDTLLDEYASVDTTDLVKSVFNLPEVDDAAKYSPINFPEQSSI